MKKTLAIVLIGLAAGCASPVKQTANEDAAKKSDTALCPYQRFVPVDFPAAGPDSRGLFALDTQTGQLCRTADYSFEKPIAGLNKIPTCPSISQAGKSGSSLTGGGFAAWDKANPPRKP